MKDNKNKEKINTKKAFYSVLSMIILILSVSYFFQSCDASLIPPIEDESTVDLIDDFIQGDDDDLVEEENYFSFDITEQLISDRPTVYVENEETASIEITEFYEERAWGWSFISGFEEDDNNGLFSYEIEDNILVFNSDGQYFNARIDYNNCWQVDNYLYSKIEINEIKYNCYIVLD